MDNLEFKQKLEIKKMIETKIHSKEKDEKKINLLKGSLEIEKKKEVENLLKEEIYTYKSDNGIKEARSFCIGKAIVVLGKDRDVIIKFISLENFNSGIREYMSFVGGDSRKNSEENKIIVELDRLRHSFKNLGKGNKIKKGKILEEIDMILTENENIESKKNMWESLGIIDSTKSMLCKRYNLFKEFENSKTFLGEEGYRRAIENMTDLNLKRITKRGISIEEKEEMILEEMLNGKGEPK